MEFYELLVLLLANIILTGIVFFSELRFKRGTSNIHPDGEGVESNMKT